MFHRSLAVAAGCIVFLGGTVQAAEPTKPLRTLVYSVEYGAHNRNEEQTSGFNSAGNGSGGTAGGTVTRNADVGDAGTLTVDVVAATPDGGLVVDAAYVGKTTSQSAVRVAIFADGQLSSDPRTPLNRATVELLPLLARGLIAGRTLAPGVTWSADAPPPGKGTWNYTVAALDGQIATMDVEGKRAVGGTHGFEEDDKARAVYDTEHLCPLSYDLTAISHHSADFSQFVTSNAHFTAKLVSDSFAKH